MGNNTNLTNNNLLSKKIKSTPISQLRNRKKNNIQDNIQDNQNNIDYDANGSDCGSDIGSDVEFDPDNFEMSLGD